MSRSVCSGVTTTMSSSSSPKRSWLITISSSFVLTANCSARFSIVTAPPPRPSHQTQRPSSVRSDSLASECRTPRPALDCLALDTLLKRHPDLRHPGGVISRERIAVYTARRQGATLRVLTKGEEAPQIRLVTPAPTLLLQVFRT